jgi:hypothetical protein
LAMGAGGPPAAMDACSATGTDAAGCFSGIVPTPVLQDRPDYIAGVADAANVRIHRGRGLRCTPSHLLNAVISKRGVDVVLKDSSHIVA